MGQFRVFLIGCGESLPIAVDAESVPELAHLTSVGRFLAAELIDFPGQDGICESRPALIPLSRIQMIVEDVQ